MAHTPDQGKAPFLRSPAGIAVVLFGAIAAFFLVAEHRAHALGFLPYLILLACPLLHVFMHRGHGGHGGHAGHSSELRQAPEREPAKSDRGGGTSSGGSTQ